MGNIDSQELEHIIRSRGWRPIGLVKDTRLALKKLLTQSRFSPETAKEALNTVDSLIHAQVQYVDKSEYAKITALLFEDVFFMYVFSRTQDKDYTIKLRKMGLTFLKLNKTDQEVELIIDLLKVLQKQADQEEMDAASRRESPETRFNRALQILCNLRNALDLPENENADLEGRLEKAVRKSVENAVFYDGDRLILRN